MVRTRAPGNGSLQLPPCYSGDTHARSSIATTNAADDDRWITLSLRFIDSAFWDQNYTLCGYHLIEIVKRCYAE